MSNTLWQLFIEFCESGALWKVAEGWHTYHTTLLHSQTRLFHNLKPSILIIHSTLVVLLSRDYAAYFSTKTQNNLSKTFAFDVQLLIKNSYFVCLSVCWILQTFVPSIKHLAPPLLSACKVLAPKGLCTLYPPSKIINLFHRSWNRL